MSSIILEIAGNLWVIVAGTVAISAIMATITEWRIKWKNQKNNYGSLQTLRKSAASIVRLSLRTVEILLVIVASDLFKKTKRSIQEKPSTTRNNHVTRQKNHIFATFHVFTKNHLHLCKARSRRKNWGNFGTK